MNLLLPFAEEQLDLRLCFFNFDSGRKVSLTFDLSCLKRLVLFSFSFNDLFHFKFTYCDRCIYYCIIWLYFPIAVYFRHKKHNKYQHEASCSLIFSLVVLVANLSLLPLRFHCLITCIKDRSDIFPKISRLSTRFVKSHRIKTFVPMLCSTEVLMSWFLLQRTLSFRDPSTSTLTTHWQNQRRDQGS